MLKLDSLARKKSKFRLQKDYLADTYKRPGFKVQVALVSLSLRGMLFSQTERDLSYAPLGIREKK